MQEWLSSEEEILNKIIINKSILSNTIRFALVSVFPYPQSPFEYEIDIAVNVLRHKLQLKPDQKPGDIDLLIIPSKDGKPHYSKTIALEVKIVRPSVKKPSRDANSSGLKQVNGLFLDGFPFVGLVHISIPEPLPSNLLIDVETISDKMDENNELVETGQSVKTNFFPVTHAERHEGRIKSLDLSEDIAYKVISLHLSKDKQNFVGNTFGRSKTGNINPNYSRSLVENIKSYHISESTNFKKINWSS